MGTLYLVRHGQASFGADDYDKLSELGHVPLIGLLLSAAGLLTLLGVTLGRPTAAE